MLQFSPVLNLPIYSITVKLCHKLWPQMQKKSKKQSQHGFRIRKLTIRIQSPQENMRSSQLNKKIIHCLPVLYHVNLNYISMASSLTSSYLKNNQYLNISHKIAFLYVCFMLLKFSYVYHLQFKQLEKFTIVHCPIFN